MDFRTLTGGGGLEEAITKFSGHTRGAKDDSGIAGELQDLAGCLDSRIITTHVPMYLVRTADSQEPSFSSPPRVQSRTQTRR